MDSTSPWVSRPIFITSTFFDMQSERDHLRTHVFPALEEWARTKYMHLEWIDLRAGVASASTNNEAERELMVLKVCLNEVERSRPFLIALIGDRYGWVPSNERIKAAATEMGVEGEVEGRSVTDLEIEFGVFKDLDQQCRSLFFMRAALPYETMRPEVAAGYSDAHCVDDGAAERQARLEKLKKRVERDFSDRCFEYTTTWNVAEERVTGLEKFGREVEAQVRKAIEAELAINSDRYSHDADAHPEVIELEVFTEERARDFVGRKDLMASVEAFLFSSAEEDATWGLCITGEAGSGKSALFSVIYRDLTAADRAAPALTPDESADAYPHAQVNDALVLAHAAGSSPGSASVDAMLRRWVVEIEAFLDLEPSLSEASDPDIVDAAFASLLARAAQTRRVIVLVDALDQFEQTPRGRFGTWLPRNWPANARIIATAIPGEASAELTERSGFTAEALQPLDAEEARQIAIKISARYHRMLEPEILDTLIPSSGGANASWHNPLWLVLATEELNLLDADDFALARTLSHAREDERLRAYMCDKAASFPADVAGLYRASFLRAADLFGRELTKAFLGLIAASRAGWREGDFRELLPVLSGENWDYLRFSQLRRLFRGQIRQRGSEGRWNFAHTQMNAAASEYLAFDDNEDIRVHARSADHLLSLPANDEVRQSECMYHLLESRDAVRSARYYGGDLRKNEEEAATASLASMITTDDEGVSVCLSMLDCLPEEIETTLANCRRWVTHLNWALKSLMPIRKRREILRSVENCLKDVAVESTKTTKFAGLFANCLHAIGEVSRDLGDNDAALSAYQQALDYIDDYLESEQIKDSIIDTSKLEEGIGFIWLSQRNPERAFAHLQRAILIHEEFLADDPQNPERIDGLAGVRAYAADALLELGKTEEALQHYSRAVDTAKELASRPKALAHWVVNYSTYLNKLSELQIATQTSLPEVIENYRTSLAFMERVCAVDPGNLDHQLALSFSCIGLGDACGLAGDYSEALCVYRRAVEARLLLVSKDATNTVWLRALAVAHDRVGDALAVSENFNEAVEAYQSGRHIFRDLLTQHEDDQMPQHDLSVNLERLGNTSLRLGRLDEAEKFYDECLDCRMSLLAANPNNSALQRSLSIAFEKKGDLLFSREHYQQSAEQYGACEEIRQHLLDEDPRNISRRQELATCYDRLATALLFLGHPEALPKFDHAIELIEELAFELPQDRGIQDAADNIRRKRLVFERGQRMEKSEQSQMEVMEAITAAVESGDQQQIAGLLTSETECRFCQAQFVISEGLVVNPDPNTLFKVTCPKCVKPLFGFGLS